MKGAVKFFVVAAVTATLAFLVLALGQWQRDQDRFVLERALAVARGVALGAAVSPGEVQGFVAALPAKVEGVERALVLEGTKFLAHTDAGLAGTRLDRQSTEHKALYDAAARLRAVVGKNEQERARRPELRRDPYPELEARSEGELLAVATPAEDDGGYAAMAEVRLRPVEAPVRPPLLFLGIALAAIVLFALLAPRLTGTVAVSAGVVLLLAMLGAQAYSLARWRQEARLVYADAMARTVAGLADAGLLRLGPAEPTGGERPRPELTAALGRTVEGAAGGILDIAPVGVAPAAGASSFAHQGYRVTYAAGYFAAEAARDVRHLLQWSVGFALVALAGFLLGVYGQLRRARDTVVRHRIAYGYLAPAMLALLVLVFIPITFGLVLGFMERRYNVFEFAGLENYIGILSDFDFGESGNFYFTLGVTVLWTVVNVALHVSIGLFLALLLNDQMLKARGIYRVLLIIPWAIPNYITALIWKGMFHKQFGAVNFFLDALGVEPIAWFQEFWPAFSTNVITNAWLGFPFMMVVSLGALQSIPGDLYEAAWVDGAKRWHRFRYITLPLLMPALVPAVMVGIVWTFNMFNIIYLVSGGAPNGKTDILITDAFRWAFERDRYGYAAAYSTLIFLVLYTVISFTNRMTRATKSAYE